MVVHADCNTDGLALRKFVAPEIVFGVDSRFLTGRYARNVGGRKVLVVTDPGVIAAGWTSQVLESLEAEGVEFAVFSGVTPNPTAEQVMRGSEVYRSEACNAIVAVGGGSPMDCAKGIGIVISNGGSILEFQGADRVPKPGPPLICVPTTAGSSADVSQFAIINDTQRRVKVAIVSKAAVPDTALIDPVTTTTMDASLTANTGLDALTHAIEAYVSNAHSSITDVHALEAIRLIARSLVAATRDPRNVQVRGDMTKASMHAGLAFSNASLGAVHAMAHSLGGLLDLPHGECNAILLPEVIAYNYEAAPQRYARIAQVLAQGLATDEPAATQGELLDLVIRLKEHAGVHRGLRDVGMTREDIPALAMTAMMDPCMVTNPQRPTREQIEETYERAF